MKESIEITCCCCKKIFFIGRNCFRNQAYCSKRCRKDKQLSLHRARQKKYRQILNSELNHQDNLIGIPCACCGDIFFMCRSCYRNHKYCSNWCRKTKQLELHRIRQKNYRQTKCGRLNHQDDEKRRRKGQKKKKHGCCNYKTDRKCCIYMDNQTFEEIKSVLVGKVRTCNKCGCTGKVVFNFPKRGYKKK